MQTAIATSLSLRCYGVLSPRQDSKVAITAPDLEADHAWRISSLPWDQVPPKEDNNPAEALDPVLLAAIEKLVSLDRPSKTGFSASVAFLYVYMAMAGTQDEALAVTLTVSANLPIGAGLGSSAAFSACLSSALLLAHRHIDSITSLTSKDIDAVDAWSFLSEKVLHGNPSGIDNAVSVRGGAVAFTRAVEGKTGGLSSMRGFGSIRLLLTNTRVPRDTKSLVAGVAAKRRAEPTIVDPVLTCIQSISDEAVTLLDGKLPVARDMLVTRLADLMRANHVHLRTLGVSHPSLEAVVATTDQFGLTTKLTGAGGGGCAVTLVPDGYEATALDSLLAELRGLGAEPYVTELGGPGLGISAVGGDVAEKLRTAGRDGLVGWSEELGWVHAE